MLDETSWMVLQCTFTCAMRSIAGRQDVGVVELVCADYREAGRDFIYYF